LYFSSPLVASRFRWRRRCAAVCDGLAARVAGAVIGPTLAAGAHACAELALLL